MTFFCSRITRHLFLSVKSSWRSRCSKMGWIQLLGRTMPRKNLAIEKIVPVAATSLRGLVSDDPPPVRRLLSKITPGEGSPDKRLTSLLFVWHHTIVGHDDPDKENKRPKTRLMESRQVNKTKGPKVQTGWEVRVKKDHVLGHMLNPVPNVIVVQGRWWSKNVFRNARLAGLSRDDAWTKAFVS